MKRLRERALDTGESVSSEHVRTFLEPCLTPSTRQALGMPETAPVPVPAPMPQPVHSPMKRPETTPKRQRTTIRRPKGFDWVLIGDAERDAVAPRGFVDMLPLEGARKAHATKQKQKQKKQRPEADATVPVPAPPTPPPTPTPASPSPVCLRSRSRSRSRSPSLTPERHLRLLDPGYFAFEDADAVPDGYHASLSVHTHPLLPCCDRVAEDGVHASYCASRALVF